MNRWVFAPRLRFQRRGWHRGAPFGAVLIGMGLALGTDVTICPLAGLLGIPCPSCGLTRASLALLRGELRSALSIHPAVLPVLFYLAVAACVIRGQPGARVLRLIRATGVLVVLALIALWLARFAGAFGGPVSVERW